MKINVVVVQPHHHMVAKMLMKSLALSMMFFVHISMANEAEYAVGKFPFLMPNVHPYRVSDGVYFIY